MKVKIEFEGWARDGEPGGAVSLSVWDRDDGLPDINMRVEGSKPTYPLIKDNLIPQLVADHGLTIEAAICMVNLGLKHEGKSLIHRERGRLVGRTV